MVSYSSGATFSECGSKPRAVAVADYGGVRPERFGGVRPPTPPRISDLPVVGRELSYSTNNFPPVSHCPSCTMCKW